MNCMPGDTPTIVSILTPPGRAAVAVVAVEGAQALQSVEQFFRAHRGDGLSGREIQQIVYGRWGVEPAEDVIACRRGENQLEVHCHGGAAAVRRIVDDLTTVGAIEVDWSVWLARNESTVVQAAAREALANAVTLRVASILLDQYHGALEKNIQSIVGLLDRSVSCPSDRSKEIESRAVTSISQLLARAPLGLHLTQPWRVVIAGPPNVGKSSLINALLGFQRAIVFDLPGTTRDIVTAVTALDGWPVELSDTAGLRLSDDPLESAGIERATAQATAADCLLLVFDASQPWSAANQELVERWPGAIVVHNKSDLRSPDASAPTGLPTSALKGQGIEGLTAAVLSKLIKIDLIPGDAVPFTGEQVAALRCAEVALRNEEVSTARSSLLALLSRTASARSD
jgi:tRNA modification GTPase